MRPGPENPSLLDPLIDLAHEAHRQIAWIEGEEPFVVSVRFTMDELDRRVEGM